MVAALRQSVHWEPYVTRDNAHRPHASAERCLGAPQQVLYLTGDSHMRYTAEALAQQYTNNESFMLTKSDTKLNVNNALFYEQMRLEIKLNLAILENPEQDFYVTAIVANIGAWPLAGFDHWSLHRYAKELDRIVHTLADYKAKHPSVRLFWVSIYPFPLRVDNEAKEWGDMRSMGRIRAFNAFANRVMRASPAGIEIIDAFAIALPLWRWTADRHHYHKGPVLDAVTQLLLDTVC
jgi:hypothetical protein